MRMSRSHLISEVRHLTPFVVNDRLKNAANWNSCDGTSLGEEDDTL